jgi:hypothetical protein
MRQSCLAVKLAELESNIAQGIRTEGYSSVTIALLPLEQRKMALAPLEKAGAFGTKFVRWNAFMPCAVRLSLRPNTNAPAHMGALTMVRACGILRPFSEADGKLPFFHGWYPYMQASARA